MKNFMVYGSYGYTGNLIVEQAVKAGFKPLLAGRDENQVCAQAEKFGFALRGSVRVDVSPNGRSVHSHKAALRGYQR